VGETVGDAEASVGSRGPGDESGRSHLPTTFSHKPGLDGLRAVAVGAVIAFHFGSQQLQGGFLGVDMFFVLSGYLITSLLVVEWGRSGTIDFVAFWVRRARRLLPALVLVVLAVAIWAALASPTDRLGSIRIDGIWTLFYGANWHFIASGQSYFDVSSEASPFRHMWSLAIEEQFYLVWPLLTFVTLRAARGRTWLLAAVCGVGLVTSVSVMGLLYDASDPSRAYYGTDSRAHGLLIGALLALFLARSRGRRSSSVWVQVAGVVAAIAVVWAFAGTQDTTSWLYTGGFLGFEVAVAVLIVAVTAPSASPLTALLSLRPIRWVGAISYGLYLWHWPVTIAISEGRTRIGGWELAGIRLAVTFALATVSYYLVEMPVRQRKWPRGRVAWVAAPVGLAVGLGVLLLGTSAATPPPDYLVADPNRVLRTEASVVTTTTRPGAAPSSAVPTPSPMAFIGDSIAATLAPSLATEAGQNGVQLDAAVRPGCGVLTGYPVDDNGARIPWGVGCSDDAPRFQQETAANASPQLVIMLSSWETADREVDGEVVKLMSDRGEEVWRRLLDESRARLSAGGAKLALVLLPGPAEFSDRGPANKAVQARIDRLNGIYRRYARDHADSVVTVDLTSIVCPGGPPCPEEVAGIRLRPRDGGHYDDAGAAWVAPRMYKAIVDAVTAPPGVDVPPG
jgi:peptidoglycan/LPS O-acetylase OafA/YrhL